MNKEILIKHKNRKPESCNFHGSSPKTRTGLMKKRLDGGKSREVKWTATKHLERRMALPEGPQRKATGEQGQFAWFLPENATIINVPYLNSSLGLLPAEDSKVNKRDIEQRLVFV